MEPGAFIIHISCTSINLPTFWIVFTYNLLPLAKYLDFVLVIDFVSINFFYLSKNEGTADINEEKLSKSFHLKVISKSLFDVLIDLLHI